MHRVKKKIGKKNGMRRDKIVLLASVLFFIAFFVYCFADSGLSLKKTTYFSSEELEVYESPIAFLKSDSERYFITLDNPDKKYILDYSDIWDSRSSSQTFLFSMESDGEEGIYEYDLSNEEYRCLIEENYVCNYLNLSQDSEFKSVYYYFDEETISFVYGNYLIIYDAYEEKFIHSTELVARQWELVYGWLTPQTLLMMTGGEHGDPHTICEVNIYTGEKTKVADNLGISLILTEDKSMGSSCGDENWFGGVYNPVYVWDTQNYKVKRFSKGASSRTQLSNDKKYVMFARRQDDKTYKILCIKVEDESLCEVYTTDDTICNIIWW